MATRRPLVVVDGVVQEIALTDDLAADCVPAATGNVAIIDAAPSISFFEDDQGSPAGRFRLRGEGNQFVLEKNTAAAADYSTKIECFRADTNGGMNFGGNVGIGNASLIDSLRINKNLTGGATSRAVIADGVVQSDATASAGYFVSSLNTAAANFTVTFLTHFAAQQATIGAGSTVTNQYGFSAASTLVGATNNYGFYGNLAAATGRWNLYMAGTAANYLAGNLGIGTSALAYTNLFIAKGITGATTAYGMRQDSVVQSDVTAAAYGNISTLGTQAAAFTLNNLIHFRVNQGTIGAGSTITNQIGFQVSSNFFGATNNYGYSSLIPAAAGNWNLYMGGTAKNYMAGNLLLGSQTDTGEKLQVTGDAKVSGNIELASGAPLLAWNETDATNPAGKFRILASGAQLLLQMNTAAAGDYSTSLNGWTMNSLGELSVTTYPTTTNSVLVASTAYVVARIAQDALLKTGGDLSGTLSILNAAPAINLIELDQTTPDGRYRLVGENNQIYFQKNTAIDGQYGTSTFVWGTDTAGNFITTTPATVDDSTRVATTEYVVNRIAQDVAASSGGAKMGSALITIGLTDSQAHHENFVSLPGSGMTPGSNLIVQLRETNENGDDEIHECSLSAVPGSDGFTYSLSSDGPIFGQFRIDYCFYTPPAP